MTSPEAITSVKSSGERLALTMLFSDLCASTQIGARLDPETYSEFLQSVRNLFDQIIPKHGGVIARVDGDGVLCIFGYPAPVSSPVQCAIDASLELHDAIAKMNWDVPGLNQTIQLHSGINSGVVLLREGDLVRGRFEVLGDATNVAARMCDHASANEVIVSESALGGDRKHYLTSQASALPVGGRTADMKVVRILGRIQSSGSSQLSTQKPSSKFIGRSKELAELDQWCKAHDRAKTAPMLVFGPAGIGKSRLIAELMSSPKSQDVVFFHGVCEAQLGNQSLQAFLQILGQAAKSEKSDVVAPQDTKGLEQFVTDFCQSVLKQAQNKLCVCVIEDWHWASDAARQMLHTIVARLRGKVRFLLTSRSDPSELSDILDFETLALMPWTTDEVADAISAILKHDDPASLSWLRDSSGGNPLFLEELCYALQRGEIKKNSHSQSAWLETLIQSRFSQMPENLMRILQMISVIGRAAPVWLLEAMSQTEFDAPTLNALSAADFVYSGEQLGTIRFKHGITRDAVYAMVGPSLRQQLHSLALDVLTAKSELGDEATYLDALAYHSFASGRIEPALSYAMKVGEQALATGGLDRAQAHFVNAFTLTQRLKDPQRVAQLNWSILNKYGLACMIVPDPLQVPILASMVEAVAPFSDPRQKARGEFWLATLNYGLGRGKTAVRFFRKALEIAKVAQDEKISQQIEIKLALALFAAGYLGEANARFEKFFDEVLAGFQSTNNEGLVYAMACYEMLIVWRGQVRVPAKLAKLQVQASAIEGTPTSINVLFAKARNALIVGEWHVVVKTVLQGLETAKELQMPYQIKCAQAWLAIAQWKLTRAPVHLETIEKTALWFEGGHSLQRTSFIYGLAAEVFEEAGDAQRTRNFAARALARSRTDGDALGEAVSYRTLAMLSAKLKHVRRSKHYLAKANIAADRMLSNRDCAFNQVVEAKIAILDNKFQEARKLLSCARAEFARMEMPFFLSQTEALLKAIDQS